MREHGTPEADSGQFEAERQGLLPESRGRKDYLERIIFSL